MSKVKLGFSFLLTLLFVGMFSVVAFAAGSNPVGTPPGDPADMKGGLVTDDSAKDNNYDTVRKSNANKTGSGVGGQNSDFNNVIKSDDMVKNADGTHGTQRTHGSYMNNTNSCASCHQTHTGASKNLLFKDGEYATCTACHDGTLGFYNVFTGSNSAGTFGGTHDGNMSVHLANGTVELKAAPGGNSTGTGNWEAEFTCASCHAPHGSYSDRLLHENPNDMGNTLVSKGGKLLENVPVVTDITAKNAAADVTYKDATGADVTINYVLYRFDIGTTVDAAYSAKGLTTGDTVLQLMKWNGTKYVNDTDPWLHGYEFDENHVKHYWTAFKDSTGKEVFDTDQLKKGEILGNGFAGVPASKTALVSSVKSLTSGNVARGYVVKLDVSAPNANNVTTTTASSLWASKKADGSTNPGYVANRGVAMSTFCSACHTDYLAGSGKETGTFDHAYRHTTTSDSYTCVRCHYAHGTDVTVMRDARGLTYQNILDDTTNYFPGVTGEARTSIVKDYLLDKNPSSALKRYTNMAVCWGCHTSSHSEGTRNTDTYQYNSTPGIDSDRNGIEFDY
ncbi:cytochrome c3 family protein [Bacillus salipaludis]|uniref:Cytochrome c3 family protein n=1 Tax=Bacillus salipaludis TaxID=2547811 RepID=A0AA90TUM4_9BACI|nr:cytochrome c3 family protein [Bacillus salipaludis]MDQ6600344.1 cytochrome c3 family protein [Bacillus salipaludis]